MFREGPLHLAISLCHTVCVANLIEPARSFDSKSMLEHDELRLEHCFQQLRNLRRTGQGMVFRVFQWFSIVSKFSG